MCGIGRKEGERERKREREMGEEEEKEEEEKVKVREAREDDRCMLLRLASVGWISRGSHLENGVTSA